MVYFYRQKNLFGPAQERYVRLPVDPFLDGRVCDSSIRCSHAESQLKLLRLWIISVNERRNAGNKDYFPTALWA